MIVPLLVGFFWLEESWKAFFIALLAGVCGGGLLFLSNRPPDLAITPRQGFVLVVLCWITLPVYAALPFWIASASPSSFTNAVFESVSGLTTTGSSIFSDVESLPASILIWRAVLQWLGGVGVIAMALTVMPFLRIGGMQLFLDALSNTDKDTPRLAGRIYAIIEIYSGLTFLCAAAYILAGLNVFDATAHALTTISTGGFSTRNASIGAFGNPAVETVAFVFMLAGGLPFLALLRAISGRRASIWRNSQILWFLAFCTLGTLLVSFSASNAASVYDSAFATLSFLTGTGFSTADYKAWGPAAAALLFFMTFAGGCSGSTSGGIKMFRFQVLYATMATQLRQLLYPNGVFIPHFQGKPLPPGVAISVLGFFFAYTIAFVLLTCLLSLAGVDTTSALSAAAAAVSNAGTGPELALGQGGNIGSMSADVKWLLIGGMLVGRLEVLTLLVLFSARFWRP